MKLIKLSFIIAVAVMAIVGISTTSYAFHSGGVANCESCHTMHNSLEGLAMAGQKSTTPGGVGDAAASKMYLLRGSDQSSTCLNCHEGPTLSSYHVSTDQATMDAAANRAPVNRTPGGDFGWLKTTFNTTTVETNKQRRGHNIVAADFGYTSDPQNLTAPGGTFDATQLNCISCHNPHNQLRITDNNGTIVKPAIGTNANAIAASISSSSAADPTVAAPQGPFRFLRGSGADQAAKSYASYVFGANPPAAKAPPTYNRAEATADTHVAYGQGMSAWCGNCHAAMNDAGAGSGVPSHPHPVDKALGATLSANYNAYKGSGDLSGTNGYSSLVPVEMGTGDYSLLKAAASSSNGGSYLAADASAKVMCLSCHRAHATAFPSMTRFNIAGNTTDAAGAYTLLSGMTNTLQMSAAYYERPSTQFTANTKMLCNKCHAKD